MTRATTIGLDIAKQVFQVHGADRSGRAVLRRKLRRSVSVRSSPLELVSASVLCRDLRSVHLFVAGRWPGHQNRGES
jgi:hypothetical protein